MYTSVRSYKVVGVDGMTNQGSIPRWPGEFRSLTNVEAVPRPRGEVPTYDDYC